MSSGFSIERSPDGLTWTEIAPSVAANLRSYHDAGVSAGNTYYYRTRRFDNGSYSGYSNIATASVPGGGIDTAALLYHHKADAIVGLSTGDLLSSWVDSSGNGNAWLNGAPDNQKPFYRTNVQNGLPAVQRFDVNRFLGMAGPFSRSGGYTFYFATAFNPAVVGEQTVLATSDDDGFPGVTVTPVWDVPDLHMEFDVDPFTNPTLFGPAPISGWQVLAYVVDVAAGKRRIYRNGVLLAQDSGTVALNGGYHDTDLLLFPYGPSDADYTASYLGEDALYGAAHDATAVARNSAVLQSKWGVL